MSRIRVDLLGTRDFSWASAKEGSEKSQSAAAPIAPAKDFKNDLRFMVMGAPAQKGLEFGS
jgi:hypothetical protein